MLPKKTPDRSVLVVDDEPAVRALLGTVLTERGLTVRLAASGDEAISLYREHQKTIALVLLDVQMPDLDGPATLAALKEINPGLLCCFMSGNTGRYSAEDLLALGAARIFPKPFASLNLFVSALSDTIASRPS